MGQGELFPINDLTAILNAGESEASSLPAADPIMDRALKYGIAEGDDDNPGIHISGSETGLRTLADPSITQPIERARRRARLGPPPQDSGEVRMTAREFMAMQGERIGAPIGPGYMPSFNAPYNPPLAVPMGASIQVQAVDFNRGVLLTSHGAIPLSPETVNKIMQLSVATMRMFFAESVNATMQAYGLGGKRAKSKRKPKKKVL